MAALALLGTSLPLPLLILLLGLVAVAAGTLGSLLGLGGGIVLVPALVLLFGVDFHLAVATSLVSVIATSSGAASTQVESGFTSVRIAMFLEMATSVGGLLGALVAVTLLATRSDLLVLIFVPVVLGSAAYMFVERSHDVRPDAPVDPLSARLRLEGHCPDPERGGVESYRASRPVAGLSVAALAGLASGLLGVGGGLFKVPAMNAVMNLPIRVAGATSTFMIGVTAAAGALVYLFAGDVAFLLTAPAAIGTIVGSRVGSALRPRASNPSLKVAFVAVLIGAALAMLAEAVGVIR